MRIAMVVGEASGDILGAGLMKALLALYPSAQFEGIGGPLMIEQGFRSLYPQDKLAVMGLVEPLKRLPTLLNIRKSLVAHFSKGQPDVFIGIDSPEFNLTLEKKLKQAGIKTVHYVSPSVWAWRQGRVKLIKDGVDLMLTLFPFEASIYQNNGIPVRFVGHPLADEIPFKNDKHLAREALDLQVLCEGKKVIGLLPGSRSGEVSRLGPLMLDVADICLKRNPECVFVVPSANEARHAALQALLENRPCTKHIRLVQGRSREVMAAADAIVIASGTATLEAMLIKRPMVIVYKMAALSHWILKRLVKSRYIGLPNLLIDQANDEPVVPEFIQKEANAAELANAIMRYIANEFDARAITNQFAEQHIRLRRDASVNAAAAIQEIVLK